MSIVLVNSYASFPKTETVASSAVTKNLTVSQNSGFPYTIPIAAAGSTKYGTPPYTWYIVSGTLPAGLTFTGSTGVISGSPTTVTASTPVVFGVKDSNGFVADVTQSITFQVFARMTATATSTTTQTLTVTEPNYPNFNTFTAASGGVTPYEYYVVSGTLPAGLTLTGATPVVSGTPTAVQAATNVTFGVRDVNLVTATTTVTVSFTVVAAPTATLNQTAQNLTVGQTGYSFAPLTSVTGGISPYTYSITSGTLPSTLSQSTTTGTVTGSVTAASSSTVVFQVVDSNGVAAPTASVPYSAAARTTATAVTTAQTLTVGQTGYSFAPLTSVSNGVTPYTYSITSGTLPGGLSLGASTGLVTGTVTSTKTAAAVVFSVRDTNGITAVTTSSVSYSAVNFSATASGTTSITVATGNAITSYNPLTAVGGVSPFTYSITSGSLPSGVTLNSTSGLVSGTPTTAQSASSVTFSVGDVNGVTAATTQTTSFTVTATRGSQLYVGSSTSSTIYQTYNWTCPAGVTSVSILCIGGGGAGATSLNDNYQHLYGGGGGGLSYVNNYAVTPGTVYLIRAGNSGAEAYAVANGGFSAFYGGPTTAGGIICEASGGVGGRILYAAPGGSAIVGTGGSGGGGGSALALSSTAFGIGGGGGAGGYSGNGGNGGSMNGLASGPTGSQPPYYVAATAGSGGGGGGGGPGAYFNSPGNYQVVFADGGAGGGTYQYGFSTGNSGFAGATPSGNSSFSDSGGQGSNAPSSLGASYGGGGSSTSSGGNIGAGVGIVRIVWPGNTRQFPSTDVNTDS